MISTPQMPAIRNTIFANLMAASEYLRGTDEQQKEKWRDSRSKPGRNIAKLAATRTKLAGRPGRKRRDAKSAEARRLQNQESEALDDAGGAHAAADAHGDHAITRIAALQFADDGGGEFCSGAAEGMAERDGAAAGIDARRVEAGLPDDGKRLSGERFVEFDDGDVAEGEASEFEDFWNRGDRADAEFFGENAGGGIGDKTREGFQAQGFGACV